MDAERDVAAALHRAVDTFPVRAFDPTAVRQRAQRRSPVTLLVATAVTASVVAIAALAVAMRTPDDPPAAADSCPIPALGVAAWPGDTPPGRADVMVSDGPTSVVVCRYGGDGPRMPQAVELPGRDVPQLVTALNELEATTQSPGPECPFDSAALYDLVLTYADGRTEVVAVNPDGCREAYNGARRSVFAPADLVTLLDRAMSS